MRDCIRCQAFKNKHGRGSGSEPRAHPTAETVYGQLSPIKGSMIRLKSNRHWKYCISKEDWKWESAQALLGHCLLNKEERCDTHTHPFKSNHLVGHDISRVPIYRQYQRPQSKQKHPWNTLVWTPGRQEEPELSHGILYFRKYLVAT